MIELLGPRTRLAMSSVALSMCMLAACAAPAETEDDSFVGHKDEAIVGGSAFSGLPAVGAITYYGSTHCTGTLVSPTRVLTAAHCVQGYRASALRFVTGNGIIVPDTTTAVRSLSAHPSLDLGIVELVSAPPGVTPIDVLAPGELNSSWVGVDLLHVGYGFSDGRLDTGDGTKRAVTMPITRVSATEFRYGSSARNTCNGDSGGPALFRRASGSYVVVGVTSYGDRDCVSFGADVRADVGLSFIGVSGSTSTDDGEPEEPPPSPTEGETETLVDGRTLALGASVYYDAIPVASGTSFRAVISGTGDADLYVRWGARPTASLFDCRPYLGTADEVCELTVPSGVSSAYIRVTGYTASTFEIQVTHTPE